MRPCRIRIGIAVAGVSLFLSFAHGQAPTAFPPLDVRIPAAPRPLVGGGRTHLVYELHITNLSARQTTLDGVEVMEGSARGAATLLSLHGTELDAAVRRFGAAPDDPARRALPGGGTAVVFVWLTLPSRHVPASLTHKLTVQIAGPAAASSSGSSPPRTDGDSLVIGGVPVAVPTVTPLVIGPPLRGNHWLAANGPGNEPDHRRTLLALSGEARIAQRFAIDWVRLFEDGRTAKGDPSRNASYRAFGSDVLAVADGVVSEIHDGIPENQPDPVARAVPIAPQTLVGNYILLDIGGGTYAVYAHLQPGSLKVKTGDRVRRGQVMGLVGNTGNSTEPHLHFHVSDRASAIDAEGIPYAFDSFEIEAPSEDVTPALLPVGNSLGLNPAGLAKWLAAAPQRRSAEIPMRDAIVAFRDR